MTRATLLAILALLGTCRALADELHVPDDFPTIQTAIDAASDGDTVIVADGVYTGPGNRDISTLGKAIVVRSENGAESCVIQGGGVGHRAFLITSGEDTETVIEGFTFTLMDNKQIVPGGAMLIEGSSPTIAECRFSDNSGYNGGALMIDGGSSPTFEACDFEDNLSVGDFASLGGAVYVRDSDAAFVDSNFVGNCAGIGLHTNWGGAVAMSGAATASFVRCSFFGNAVERGFGGAFWADDSILGVHVHREHGRGRP